MCGSPKVGALAGGLLGYALAPATGGLSLLSSTAMGAMMGANLANKPSIPNTPPLAATPEMPTLDNAAISAANKKTVSALLQQGGRRATILSGVAGKTGQQKLGG